MDGDVVPLVLFLVLAGLFALLGVFLVARPGSAAAFFADADARRRFRARDVRRLGAVFAVGGLVLAALGAIRLTMILTGG
jgi:hypothetical protein